MVLTPFILSIKTLKKQKIFQEKQNKEVKYMKFVKGVMLGTLITAGAMLLYSENVDDEKKKMIKKGKQFARKIGLS